MSLFYTLIEYVIYFQTIINEITVKRLYTHFSINFFGIYIQIISTKSYGISGQIFRLISSFFSNRQLQVVLGGMPPQAYPVKAGVPQSSILGPTLFLLYIHDLPDHVICDIAIYADDTTLYSKCDQESDMLQQLELDFELESDL